MEDLVTKLLSYAEHLGPVGSALFLVLWQLEIRAHRETKKALADSQEKRIQSAVSITAVVESSRAQLALVLEALKGMQATYNKLRRQFNLRRGGDNGSN